MKITHNKIDYELSFNTGYIDIFCFELGYEMQDVKIPVNLKLNEDGTVFIDIETQAPIELPDDKHSMKRFSEFVYCFAKLEFESNQDNKGTSFPLSVRDVFGATILWTPEQKLPVIIEMFKSLNPNMTKAQVQAIEEANNGVKKKLVGKKLKPEPTAKLD